jgi:hypothetical protein
MSQQQAQQEVIKYVVHMKAHGRRLAHLVAQAKAQFLFDSQN